MNISVTVQTLEFAQAQTAITKNFYLTGGGTANLSLVIVSAISHHQLVTIHPFTDGNGRTARALAALVLYRRGFDIKKTFALDDYYNLDRRAYYRAIRQARENRNLTSWLEYFPFLILLPLTAKFFALTSLTFSPSAPKPPIAS